MDTKAAFFSCISAILAAAITAAAMYYTNERTLEEQRIQFETQREDSHAKAEEDKKLAKVVISGTYTPKVKTIIPSVFYTELSNVSENEAKDLFMTVNFGGATVQACETLPDNYINSTSLKNESLLNLENINLLPGEKLYLYCQTDSPSYESINVTGANLKSSVTQKKDSVVIYDRDNTSNGYTTFFKFIGCIVALVFIVYFTIFGISYLNKRLSSFT